MTAYWANDVPAEPLVIDLDLLDPALFTGATGILHGPTGEVIDTAGVTFALDVADPAVTVTLTAPSRFIAPGLYSLQIHLTAAAGVQRLTPYSIVVEEIDGWHSLGSARSEWVDAPEEDDILFGLLDAARTACIAYAPQIVLGSTIPSNYRQAQLMQARAVWNSSKASNNDQLGADGLTVTVYPLDWNVKQLLRPKTGVPVIW